VQTAQRLVIERQLTKFPMCSFDKIKDKLSKGQVLSASGELSDVIVLRGMNLKLCCTATNEKWTHAAVANFLFQNSVH
jgi:hypothetical protein